MVDELSQQIKRILQEDEEAPQEQGLTTVTIVCIVVGVVVVPLCLVLFAKFLERSFGYQSQPRHVNQVHSMFDNPQKENSQAQILEQSRPVALDNSTILPPQNKHLSTIDVQSTQKDFPLEEIVLHKLTIDEFKQEVRQDFKRKETLKSKMNSQEKTLFSLFQKEAIPQQKTSLVPGDHMPMFVEVIDRPDIELSVINKVHLKPTYKSHQSEHDSQRTFSQQASQNAQLLQMQKSQTSFGFGAAVSQLSDTPPPLLKIRKQSQKAHSANKLSVNFHRQPVIEDISSTPTNQLNKQHGGEDSQNQESGQKKNTDRSNQTDGRNTVKQKDRLSLKPKAFGVLKMPIKRTVTMQPKKTVTFTENKLDVANSFYSINSVAKQNSNQAKFLPRVVESQHNDEESQEYVMSEQRTNNPLSDLPPPSPPKNNKTKYKLDRYDQMSAPLHPPLRFFAKDGPSSHAESSDEHDKTPVFQQERHFGQQNGGPLIPRYSEKKRVAQTDVGKSQQTGKEIVALIEGAKGNQDQFGLRESKGVESVIASSSFGTSQLKSEI